MKWVIFISFLCLVSFAELKNLPRRYRDVDDHKRTIKLASETTPEQFRGIALILFTQSVQRASLEEVEKLKENVVALHQKCAADEHSDPECTKPLGTVFLDILCHDEKFSKDYEFNDCCAKADPERNECILSHKNSSVGFTPPFIHPSAEEGCKAYHDNRHGVLSQHLYQVSRKYPKTVVIMLLHGTASYDKVLETCCAAADKDACFREKATEAKKKLKEKIDEQENTCFNLKNYGKDLLYTLKFIETSEKFFHADQATVAHIAKAVVHIHEETCKGDTLESLLDRVDLTDYVCKNKNSISANLDACCEKPLVDRTKCMVQLGNDERPTNLPPPSGEIINEAEACKSYAEHGQEHLDSFLFDLTRNHPELSKLLDLEIFQRYKDLLEKCCKLEDHTHCLHTGEEQLKLLITKIQDVVKKNCDQYSKIGGYFFQNEYIIKYTKTMPQLPSSNLIEFTKKLAGVAGKCCNLDSDHQSSCALEYTDKAIGYVCRYHKEHHINKQVCHCCDYSFIRRWECISNLGTDPSYDPPIFKPKILDHPEELCSPDEHTVQEDKQGLLIDLIKSFPNITETELATETINFHALQTQCCESENKKECFDIEGKKLINQINTDLGGH